MMKDIADCLQLLMDAGGHNPHSLAQSVNAIYGEGVTSQPVIRRIMLGETKEPRDSTLKPLADYFGITPLQMRDWDYCVRHITSHGRMETARQTAIKEIQQMVENASESDLEAIKLLVEKMTRSS